MGRLGRGYTGLTSLRTQPLREVGPGPPFFRHRTTMKDLQETIEARLAELEPEVELLALERPATETLRLYIDHPRGVDLALCERVTGHLRDLLESYSLEVSSPGLDRPLTKPEHFRRFLGHRVRVKTREEIAGQRSFTGRLTDADEGQVSVDPGDGPVAIPLDAVRRSNLLPEEEEVVA
jgi:ribosome maturation factor RimP